MSMYLNHWILLLAGLLVFALSQGCTSSPSGKLGPVPASLLDTLPSEEEEKEVPSGTVVSAEEEEVADVVDPLPLPSSAVLSFEKRGYLSLKPKWTHGDIEPTGYVAVVRKGAAVDWQPVNGTEYVAGEIDDNNLILASGDVTEYFYDNLQDGESYYFSIFPYNSLFKYGSETTGTAVAEKVGDLDTSFNGSGKYGTTFGVAKNHAATDIKIKDNYIYTAGIMRIAADRNQPTIVRHNQDGTLDTTWAASGFAGHDLYSTLPATIAKFVFDDDGAIYSVGEIAFGMYFISVFKTMPDGSMDNPFGTFDSRTSFRGPSESTSYGVDIFLQEQNILVLGRKSNPGQNAIIARLDSDGDLDTSFGTLGTGIDAFVYGANAITEPTALVEIPGEGFYVAGYTSLSNGSETDIMLVKYTFDGVVDTSFGTNGVFTFGSPSTYERAYAAKMQSDGGVVIVGSISDAADANADSLAIRVTPSGVLDTTFAVNGASIKAWETANDAYSGDSYYGLHVSSDDTLIISGQSAPGTDTFNFFSAIVVRMSKDGVIDNTYGALQNGSTRIFFSGIGARAVAVTEDENGSIYTCGYDWNGTNYWGLAKLLQ